MSAISVLDVCPAVRGKDPAASVTHTLSAVAELDSSSCHRYWFAEHHGARFAHGAPALMIASALERTKRIRVGAGGVMIRNHAPLAVAEQFKLLDALHDGRADIGLGAAAGASEDVARLFRAGASESFDFERSVREVLDGLGIGREDRYPAQPGGRWRGQAALLGGSVKTAVLAGRLGLGLAFPAHFSGADPRPVFDAYRSAFVASAGKPPLSILACDVCVAESEATISRLAGAAAQFMTGASGVLRESQLGDLGRAAGTYAERIVRGDPCSVARRLGEMRVYAGADEVMVMCNAADPEARTRALTSLCEEY